jgi:stalled ribosome rescue protein Dom34
MDSEEMGKILDSVENNGGSITIINSTSSAGKKLNGLKGILAKLRFKL